VTLSPGRAGYSGPVELLQYTVTGWRLEAPDRGPRGALAAVLRLRRRFINHLFTTFLPACGLLLISYSTLFFKREHFKTSVPVIITTLLGINLDIQISAHYTLL
jgi:hypothetical protein